MEWLTLTNAGVVVAIITSIISVVISCRDRRTQERRWQEAATEHAKERERSIEAVFLLISLEIDHNLERLQRLWREISVEPLRMSQSDPERDQRAFSLAGTHEFGWAKLMWEAQAARVTDALTGPQIKAVMGLYADFERLSALQADIIAAHAIAFRGSLSAPIYEAVVIGSAQDKLAVEQLQRTRQEEADAHATRLEKYREFEDLTIDVLQTGNPLRKATEPS